MAVGTFESAARDVHEARTPEELFGVDAGLAPAAYRALARILHPDANGGSSEATTAFTRLQAWWEVAQRRISSGAYGKVFATVVGKRGHYSFGTLLGRGDISDVYAAWRDRDDVVAKVVRRPVSNDLVAREWRVIKSLRDKTELPDFFPTPVESVGVREGGGIIRRVAFYERMDGFVTLQDVIDAYPAGIDPRDAAWMWRRILLALHMTHSEGQVHGAVFPEHILMHPTAHGIVLLGWTASVPTGERLSILSRRRRPEWYPVEVLHKQPVGPETDLFMAGRTLAALLVGTSGDYTRVPRAIRAHILALTMADIRHRSDDALRVRDSFDEIIERLWGPRRYRAFTWPRL